MRPSPDVCESPDVDGTSEDVLVGDGADALLSSASRDRSSHFPLTLSTLLATRWEGFQRRVLIGVLDPVGLVRIFVAV